MEENADGAAMAKWAEVYEALRARILSCELAPGTPVSELTLAKEYKCSPTPVRDALNRLRQEGLVVRESSRRQVVQGLDFVEIRNLCEARAALECACARIYLGGDAAALDAGLDDLERLARQALEIGDDRAALVHVNRDFHVALAALTHNDHLIRMVAQILEASERIFRIGLITLTASDIKDEHLRITAAARARDEARLLALLTQEATNTLQRVSENLLKQLTF
jgi:DNA-binding GntR family transcriptional regulator